MRPRTLHRRHGLTNRVNTSTGSTFIAFATAPNSAPFRRGWIRSNHRPGTVNEPATRFDRDRPPLSERARSAAVVALARRAGSLRDGRFLAHTVDTRAQLSNPLARNAGRGSSPDLTRTGMIYSFFSVTHAVQLASRTSESTKMTTVSNSRSCSSEWVAL